MRKAYVIYGVLVILLFLFYKNCSTDYKSRKDYRSTFKIGNNLYVERYCVFGSGAYGADAGSHWLTDSAHFRVYIGAYDEQDGGIWYR